MALPAWVRARALSLYLLALQGGLALGSLGWGYLASQLGIRGALDVAALFLAFNVLMVTRFSLSGAEHFDPSPWPLQEIPHPMGSVSTARSWLLDSKASTACER
jgi:Transmembrane secretion effector